MLNFFRKLFGTRQERAQAALKEQVALIYQHLQALQPLSDDALRQETAKIKEDLRTQLAPQEKKRQQLKEQAQEIQDLQKQTTLFAEIDLLTKELRQQRHQILDRHLPRAFAIVKETARRFATQEELIVTAQDLDRQLAQEHPHITLQGTHAHYTTTWQVAGHAQRWNMIHYDVQLMGGIVLHQGKIAEMGTGEGKTLVATLPAFLNALAGKGVHIITVNDYLAQRDAEWMAPLYQFHGLTVDCIERHPPHTPARKKAYQAAITYGTNSGFGFDYLRDNIVKHNIEQVQGGHEYAILDEVDQVLLDDAKTPLILSGPVKEDNSQEYRTLNPHVARLYKEQKKLVRELLQEAQEKIDAGDKKEGGLLLFRAYRALPKEKALITYLSQKGIKQILSDTEDHYLQENKKFMPEVDEPLLFTIEEHLNTISLTDKGIEYLTTQQKDPSFFILPNIATEIVTIENNPTLTLKEKITQKNTLQEAFAIKSSRLHAINQLLKAYALYEKNVDYVVLDSRVLLVDQKTGRILAGRRFSGGLHKGLEAKEGVPIEKSTETYASITTQNQFRMYHKLAGMTGTALTESVEFWNIYRLEVIAIPPNKPLQREDLNDCIYKTQHEKYNAIADQVKEIKKTNRPILLITPSVEVSEQIRKKLHLSNTQVLNAKNHHREADIIAQAGQAGAITIATQMAGRGTDIKLSPEARNAGGLYLIIVEKHKTRRVNNQSRGRAGRQGDPGTTICYLSLEDPLIVHYKHGYIGKQVDNIFEEEGEMIQHPRITGAIETIQKNHEQDHFMSRKRTLDYDDVLAKQRTIIYQKRHHALHGERIALDIMQAIYGAVEDLLSQNAHNTTQLEMELMQVAHVSFKAPTPILHVSPKTTQTVYEKVLAQKEIIEKDYLQKIDTYIFQKPGGEEIEEIFFPISCGDKPYQVHLKAPRQKHLIPKAITQAVHQTILLNVIDQYWQQHLQAMEELKDAVRHATYESRDPLLVYKFEGIRYFQHLLSKINRTCTQQMTHIRVPEFSIRPYAQEDMHQWHADHQTISTPEIQEPERLKKNLLQTQKPIGRNQRVTVQYLDGTRKERVKYKTIQKDLEEEKCKILELH